MKLCLQNRISNKLLLKKIPRRAINIGLQYVLSGNQVIYLETIY